VACITAALLGAALKLLRLRYHPQLMGVWRVDRVRCARGEGEMNAGTSHAASVPHLIFAVVFLA